MPMNPGAGKRILLIEDDTSVRRLMAKHFRRGGYVVSEAVDASEALSHMPLNGAGFDLVLTDVHLPDGSGVDLARLLHGRSPESPVVFVTGDPDAALAREALEIEGAAGYLVKPFRLFELDEVVNRVLHGVENLSPAAPEPEPEPDYEPPPLHRNRIAHLFDEPQQQPPPTDESVRMDAAAAEAAAALDTGDAYEVVEPRWPVRLLTQPTLGRFPRPQLNLRQAAVLILVLALALLLAMLLPNSRDLNAGSTVITPTTVTPAPR